MILNVLVGIRSDACQPWCCVPTFRWVGRFGGGGRAGAPAVVGNGAGKWNSGDSFYFDLDQETIPVKLMT
jgi:hypothetical protein